jgi:hypothetical protein
MQIAKKTGVEEKVKMIDDQVSKALGRKSLAESLNAKASQRHKGTQALVQHVRVPENAYYSVELGNFVHHGADDPAMEVCAALH